jgi:excisionase family DNA binding protein
MYAATPVSDRRRLLGEAAAWVEERRLESALAAALAGRLAGLAARRMHEQSPIAQPSQAPGNLLTVAEAADRLRVPADWIYRRSRRLPFIVRLGARGLRISPAKLEAYIRQLGANVS